VRTLDDLRPNQAPAGTSLVLGGSRGIGASVVRRLARRSRVVHVASREGGWPASVPPDEAVRTHRVDATDFSQVSRLLADVGQVDWIVSCVGLGYFAPLAGDYSQAWDEILRVNVASLANLLANIDMVLPDLHTLVVLLSLAAYQPSTTPGNTMYSAAKAAARRLLDEHRTRVRAAGQRLRVCSVSPGYVRDTGFADHFFAHEPAETIDLYAGQASLLPDDVAGLVEYCLVAPDSVEISEVIMRCIPGSEGSA